MGSILFLKLYEVMLQENFRNPSICCYIFWYCELVMLNCCLLEQYGYRTSLFLQLVTLHNELLSIVGGSPKLFTTLDHQ